MDKRKNIDIDLGLTALCEFAKPGQCLNYAEIADVCGVSREAIIRIKRNALAKLKRNRKLRSYYDDN